MESVTGIGGVFLRGHDHEALRQWYQRHLGIEIDPEYGGHVFQWTEPGSTVWAVFDRDTDYFGGRGQQTMVNYRVRDLAAMLAQLRAAGVAVDDRVEDTEYGQFGWATDPQGTRFELWQPPPQPPQQEQA